MLAAIFSVACLTLQVQNLMADTPSEKKEPKLAIDRSDLQSPEWLAAIQDATQHQRDKGFYTLLRIKMADINSPLPTQLVANKLKELTPVYNGGGGRYQVAKNGDFVLWEHTNVNRQKDSIDVGHLESGTKKFWTDLPPRGTLNVLGDIVIRPCTQNRGHLQIDIGNKAATNNREAVIGPLIVGGLYGHKYALTADGTSEPISLAPGDYKILFPNFDKSSSRWDFTIRPGTTTLLKFTETPQE